ncbi:hypothetical protein KSS87_020232, partial [Heliosperma pusillum]
SHHPTTIPYITHTLSYFNHLTPQHPTIHSLYLITSPAHPTTILYLI